MEGQENENIGLSETTTTVVAPKEKLLGKLKGYEKYKGKEYGENDDITEDVLSLIDELDANSKSAENFKQGMMKLVEENPIIAYILESAKNGVNPISAIQGMVDSPEEMMLREGDDGYDNVQNKIKERIQREAADREIMGKWDSAMETFPKTFKSWVEGKNITDADKNDFADFLSDTMTKLATGQVDAELLDRMWESFKYKSDIGALSEDMGIAKANEMPVTQTNEPIMPMPENAGNIAIKQETPRKLNPMEQMKNAGRM